MNSWTTNVFRRVFASTRGSISNTKPSPPTTSKPHTNAVDSEEKREMVVLLLSTF
ncbi:hypothetical protein K7432_005884 [Basidiobolus ranarum]|uniref:Uncharacterized protein n=1 Tax=Basidiobolus ranarum TaxID=34480 RepID=A0ABR2WVR3_9FUNG